MKKITLLICVCVSIVFSTQAQNIQQNGSVYGSKSVATQTSVSLEQLLERLALAEDKNGIDWQQFTNYERQIIKAHFNSQNAANRGPQATLLTEEFDDITTMPGAGFTFVNASDVPGSTDWFQGNDGVFPSQSGAPTAYIGANFNNTGGSVINNFMITPELNLENGDEIIFWTRSVAGSAFPDRLEVRISPDGSNVDPAGPADVGSYTELLLEINPTLVAGGYPEVWTQFTVPITGLTGATDTRVAFRYWVTDGGPTGNNSDYIGIDSLSIEEGSGGGGGCAIVSDCNLVDSTPDDATSPDVWDRPFANGTCCSGLGPVSYDVYGPFTVDVTGLYTVDSDQDGGAWDGYIFLYENCFDPLDQTTNFVAGDDDGPGGVGTSQILDVTLNAGTEYYLITTGFGAGDFGDFTNTITGVGTVTCGGPVLTYDDCAGAIAVSCGDSVVGETITATDSGGNSAPDVFYKFTGSGSSQLVTISLCGGGTDYDSALRVFDDCDLLNEIAFNDDFCGLQSEVTFVSDGTSTYYIMVEGFGSSSGNFSLDVTCQDPLPNDECSGAIAVSCGDSVTGSTVGATIDAGAPACGPAITSPGVWYSFNDNSGLPGDITVSLCNGTDFDSKLSIYSGDCGALVCVDGNDDFCGLQSEVTFASDGNTQYYILVHSFGGATGNFTLDVTCMPTPPPNDMIANSIDVDEIGFPYTDPAVAMPAATTENGNPQGCDLTGANGVWYNFVAGGDGTANATIVTPGGASSVTFYTAPDENATETDLVLVPQQTNQCVPGTSASIYTLAGQAYYVFVLNTGAITDITIDGTNLGVSDNDIAGFSYYPNPTEGIVNLKSVENIEQVSLYNMLGQLVVSNRVDATTSQVDISGLSVGTYLMKVTVNGQIGTYKVIKN